MRQTEAVEKAGAAGTDDLVLEIPPDPEHARTARLFAAAAARHFEVDEERVEDLKVAISEAVTNAIKSHRKADTTEAIVILAAPESGGVRFDVVDAGPGFDPQEAMRASGDDYTPPMGLSEGTLGLAVIKSLFDSIEITRNPKKGMTVSILVEASALR